VINQRLWNTVGVLRESVYANRQCYLVIGRGRDSNAKPLCATTHKVTEMKFTLVAYWSWNRFFSGPHGIYTNLEATEKQVKNWIEGHPSRGGSGNYDQKTLLRQTIKVKTTKVTLTQV
jgi:hypothetical protein